MEITQHPSTIGEMTPGHFEAYIIAIIKHVTDERFDRIEKRLDKIEGRLDLIEHRLLDVDERLTSLENKFDRLERNNDVIGALVLKHDSKLRDMAMA